MPTRVLSAPSAADCRFPRWGFLDKYAVNEYLPRAFLITVAVVCLCSAGVELWVGHLGMRAPAPPDRTVVVSPEAVSPLPPPSIRPTLERSGGGPPAVAVTRAIVPVPVPGPVPEPVTVEGGSGPGERVDGTVSVGVEPSGAFAVPEVGARWPEPDELVVVEHEPVLIAMRSPVYPEIASDAGIEGVVLVRVLVDPHGFVRDALILQSVRGLDEAALEAAQTAVFKPALQQDRPVAVWVVVPIEFRLRG